MAVLNLQGRVFMPPLENPFLCGKTEVELLRNITKIIFVDMHAEATSEKIALARMLDGRVSAVVGTHTHVQTADEQIFPGGTAYLSDAEFYRPARERPGPRNRAGHRTLPQQHPAKIRRRQRPHPFDKGL